MVSQPLQRRIKQRRSQDANLWPTPHVLEMPCATIPCGYEDVLAREVAEDSPVETSSNTQVIERSRYRVMSHTVESAHYVQEQC